MERTVNMMIEAYTKVMGIEKWNSLNGEEQRAVIMTMVNELSKALDRIEAEDNTKEKGLITERTDRKNNELMAYQFRPETLDIVYITNEGEFNEIVFEEGELKDGLYRLWKILGWMEAGFYNNEQRMSFLRTGTMA